MVGHFDPGQGGRLLSSRDRYGDENGAGGLNTFTTTSCQLLSGRSVKAQNGNKWENLHAGVFPVKCQQSLKKKTPEGWNSPLGSRYFSTWSSDEWPPRQTGELYSSTWGSTKQTPTPLQLSAPENLNVSTLELIFLNPTNRTQLNLRESRSVKFHRSGHREQLCDPACVRKAAQQPRLYWDSARPVPRGDKKGPDPNVLRSHVPRILHKLHITNASNDNLK